MRKRDRTRTEGRADAVVAILKGIQPETLDFDVGDMPLASAQQVFSYEELPTRSNEPYAMGLVEAMLGMSDQALSSAMPTASR